MSAGLEIFKLQEEDARMMLAASTQLGTSNLNFQMERYVYSRRADGVYVMNMRHTWEKILLAARVIVTIENHADVFVLSSRPYGMRPVFKFAAHTGATPIVGRFTPGMFTNRIQSKFREPSLLVVADPLFDHQPISEGSLTNVPVIGLCTSDTPLRFVDVAIPCNNKAPNSIGLVWWLLAREVLRLRGVLQRGDAWSVAVDLFLYRDPEDVEKDDMAMKESPPAPVSDKLSAIDVQGMAPGDFMRSYLNEVATNNTKTPEPGAMSNADWGAADANDWANEDQIQETSAPTASPPPPAVYSFGNDWAAEVQAMEDTAAATAIAAAAVEVDMQHQASVDQRESEWDRLAAEWED